MTSKDVLAELRRIEKRVEEGGYYGFEQSIWMHAANEIDRLTARIAELVKVLEAAVDDDGGISYAHSTDLIGYHLCCGTISYDPHHDSCWVSLARAVLKESK